MWYVFNYINLDIRILHTLMYQVDLCYTDIIIIIIITIIIIIIILLSLLL